jgi:hypothetical protein
MDVNYFVEMLKCYGGSVHDDAVSDVFSLCFACMETRTVLKVAVPSDTMQVCTARLVRTILSNHHNLYAWKCLCFLASKKCNSGAEEMLMDFATQDCCCSMLANCGMLISNSRDGEELMYCFRFLFLFANNSGCRQSMVYNDAILRGAVFNYLAGERFVQSSCATQASALEAADSVVKLFFCFAGDQRAAEIFLRGGVLHAVKCAALHVFSLGTARGNEQWARCDTASRCLWRTLGVTTSGTAELRTQLSEDLNKLSRNDMYRLSVAIYHFLPSSRIDPEERFSPLVTGYGEYLLEVCGADALEGFLLYKPPRDAAAKPVALFMAEWAIESGGVCDEAAIMEPLQRFAQSVPAVAEILNSLPPPPRRTDKGRRCAGCNRNGEGLYNKMKKCGRCKAAYYCCANHQRLHWPEHKLACAKTGEPVAETQGVRNEKSSL